MYNWELDVISILIFWDPGNWKTAVWTIISLDDYKNIYSNVDIFIHWKRINKQVRTMEDIDKINFDPTQKSVIIIDEMGVNWSARRSMSQENMQFWELDALKRKKNCDVIWIAQLHRMFDVYQRELAKLIIEMRKFYKPWSSHPLFLIEILKTNPLNTKRLDYQVTYEIDIFKIHEEIWMTYNQLDNSKLTKKENDSSNTKKERVKV